MNKLIVFIGFLIGINGAIFASAEELTFVPDGTDLQVMAVPAEDVFFPEMTEFNGNTSDVTFNPNNYCFDAISQTTFTYGSRIATNSFWKDQADADGINEYNVSLGVKLPNGNITIINEWTATFSGLTPGVTYGFCAAEFTQTPGSGPQGLAVPWGKKVLQIGPSDQVQNQLGTIIMQ